MKVNNFENKDSESNIDNCNMEGLIKDFGQIILNNNNKGYKIHLLNIIGEIEGHENATPVTKTSKYEHIIPLLAAVEENQSIDGK